MDILIVEDQEETRNRLALSIDGQTDMKVVAAVDMAEKALERGMGILQ